MSRLNEMADGDAAVIEELYLAAFSRRPTEQEQQTLLDLVKKRKSRPEALNDLLWAVLNSREFLFNH